MVGTDRGHPLLDHQPRARAGGPFDAEAQTIVSAAFRGKRYAVFGLARSGLAAVRALVASGTDVIAWDDNEAPRQAAGGAVLGHIGAPDLKSLRLDALVESPRVLLNLPHLSAPARSHRRPLS